jgi:hypothetical protein
MGLDIYANIIVGEKLTKKEYFKKVKKYNEDTGEAYISNIQEFCWCFESDNTVLLDFKEYENDFVHFCSYDNNFAFLGFIFISTGSHRDNEDEFKLINFDELEKCKSKYLEMFKRKAEVYLTQRISY